MVQCIFCGAQNRTNGRRFHKFPLDNPQKLRKWLDNMNVDETFHVTEHSRLCSDHFEKKALQINNKVVSLLPASIPTLFDEYKVTCTVCRCKKVGKTKSFHRFPVNNPQLLDKWLSNIDLNNFRPTKDDYLCSDHFSAEQYRTSKGRNTLRLKNNAVPKKIESATVKVEDVEVSESQEIKTFLLNEDTKLIKTEDTTITVLRTANQEIEPAPIFSTVTEEIQPAPVFANMVYSCCVRGCTKNNKEVMMHRFPTDELLFEKWIQAIGRPELREKNRKNYKVCDLHFDQNSKFHFHHNKTNLKVNSVPSENLPGSSFVLPSIQTNCDKDVIESTVAFRSLRKDKLNWNAVPFNADDVQNEPHKDPIFSARNTSVGISEDPTFTYVMCYSKLCRLCLKMPETLLLIRDLHFAGKSLSAILKQHTQIDVDSTWRGNLPTKICLNCLGKLTQTHRFVESCMNSEKELLNNTFKPHTYAKAPTSKDTQSTTPINKKCIPVDDKMQVEEHKVSLLKDYLRDLLMEVGGSETVATQLDTIENANIKSPHLDEIPVSFLFENNQLVGKDLPMSQPQLQQKGSSPIAEPPPLVSLKKIREFKCHLCSEVFKRKLVLKEHINRHKNIKSHVCERCGEGFFSERLMLSHIKKIHEPRVRRERKHKCPDCPKAFVDMAGFNKHRISHQPMELICEKCGIVSHSAFEHRSHTLKHSYEKKPKCADCNLIFDTKEERQDHVQKFHPTSYLCTQCGKHYFNSGAYYRHMRVHKPKHWIYNCRYCSKVFYNIYRRDMHERIHLNDKRYACTICGLTFVQGRYLKQHMFVHTGEKPYVCTYPDCSRAFSFKTSLNVHRRIHTGERPYKCPNCDLGFIDNQRRRKHMVKCTPSLIIEI